MRVGGWAWGGEGAPQSVNVAQKTPGEEEEDAAASSLELLQQRETTNRRRKHVFWPNVQVSRRRRSFPRSFGRRSPTSFICFLLAASLSLPRSLSCHNVLLMQRRGRPESLANVQSEAAFCF